MDLTKLCRDVKEAQTIEEMIALDAKVLPLFALDENTHNKDFRPLTVRSCEVNVQSSSLTAFQFRKFCDDLSVIHGEIQDLITICDMCMKETDCFRKYSKSAQAIFATKEAWEKKRKHVMHQLVQLREKAKQLHLPLHLLAEENELFLELEKKGLAALEMVKECQSAEEQQQPALVKKNFLAELDKIVQWTEEQVVNLEAVQEDSADLQLFAYDLIAPARKLMVTVDALFDKVRESALVDAEVVKRLRQFGEMWFYLFDALAERLSFTMIEIHDTKPLEELLLESTETYFMDLPKFIQEVNSACTEAKGTTGDETAAALTTAVGLHDFEKLLASWRERYSLQKSAFNLFRNSALSRLTYVASEDTVLSVQRQHDLDTVTKDLTKWAEEESRSESWSDIYNAVVNVKRTVSQMLKSS